MRPDGLRSNSGGLAFSLGLATVLAQVDVVVNPLHPAYGDDVVLAIRTVVLGQLDLAPLDVINLPELVPARAETLHVLADVAGRPGRATAPAEGLLGLVLDLL